MKLVKKVAYAAGIAAMAATTASAATNLRIQTHFSEKALTVSLRRNLSTMCKQCLAVRSRSRCIIHLQWCLLWKHSTPQPQVFWIAT